MNFKLNWELQVEGARDRVAIRRVLDRAGQVLLYTFHFRDE